MNDTQIIPPPPKITYVKCHRCKLIHVHGWAHYCPKAPDLSIKHPDLPKSGGSSSKSQLSQVNGRGD